MIAVSRKFHEPPRLATTVSRAFHAWLAHPSPNIPEDAPEPEPAYAGRHNR